MEFEANSLVKIVKKNLLEFPSLSKDLWSMWEIVFLGGVDTLWGEDKVGEGLGPGEDSNSLGRHELRVMFLFMYRVMLQVKVLLVS